MGRYDGRFIKGDRCKQAFASIDRVLGRFSRRLCRVVEVVVPPIPIGCYWEVPPDVLLKYMFPAKGVICRAVIAIGSRTDRKKVVVIHSTMASALGSVGRKFEVKKSVAIIEMKVPTKAGDRLTITIDDPIEVRDVWVALLWRPDISETETKQLLIDKLDELENDCVKESTGDSHALSGEGEVKSRVS